MIHISLESVDAYDKFGLSGYTVDRNVLVIDGERWSLSENYILANDEGELKRFEYALKFHEEEELLILLETGERGYANISYFCNYAKGISAKILGLIIGSTPSLDEKNFANSNGVTLLSCAKISYPTGYVKEISKQMNGLFKYSKHSRNSVKRRSREEVIGEILALLNEEGGLSITKIIYGCNLNYQYAVRVLDYLISKRLLLLNDLGNRRIFRITDDGKNMLNKLSAIDL